MIEKEQLKDIEIGVIGLGYVGLPLAVEFGRKRSVVGFDISQKRISELKGCNDITQETPASFEPMLDYVVTKIPRFAFEKFPN